MGNRQQLLSNLIDLLEEQAGLFEKILRSLLQQRGFILSREIEGFKQTVREQERLLNRVREIEAQRRLKIQQLAEELGLKEEQINLTTLAAISEDGYLERLIKLKQCMPGLMRRIQRINQGNLKLIQGTLSLLKEEMGFLTKITSLFYSEKGCREEGGVKVIDRKI